MQKKNTNTYIGNKTNTAARLQLNVTVPGKGEKLR